MPEFDFSDIRNMDKIFRLNLINSCAGYKSANLIGTKSEENISNVAVFSSVTHLGSNPPLIGFVLRPLVAERQTYRNIKSTGYYTINHVNSGIIEHAHQSSAKYAYDVSEFDKTGLTEEYRHNFFAPFVGESKVKLGLKFLEEYYIKANDTMLIVGQIEHLIIEDSILHHDGWLNLEKADTCTISALDTYSSAKALKRFEYAKPDIQLKEIKLP